MLKERAVLIKRQLVCVASKCVKFYFTIKQF